MLQVQGSNEQFAATVTDNDSRCYPEANPEARGAKRRCLAAKCFNGNNGDAKKPRTASKYAPIAE
jgi:hypothetical protein